MQYALISDVHGNFDALESVLSEIDALSPDEVICLGDIVGYGAEPARCMAEIRGRDMPCVAGNHDHAVAGIASIEYFNPAAKRSVFWARSVLSGADIDYLAGLPLVLERDAITCFHGSLNDPAEFNYILSALQAMASFSLLSKPAGFFGHSHVPVSFVEEGDSVVAVCEETFQIPDHGKALINVGSVGQPRDNTPLASFATYDTESRRAEIHRIAYNVEAAAQKIVDAGLPESNAYRLVVGR
jgi:predicted phosphodiesterase